MPIEMKIITRLLINILLLGSANSFLFSQNIENVHLNVIAEKIIVNYDLINCSPKKRYDISVRFLNGNKVIYPKSIIGDLDTIICGKDKSITWDVLKDIDDLSGNMTAIVEISKSHSIKTPGGPSNALLSLLVPGLGVKFVTSGQKKWYVRTIVVYGLYAIGAGCKLISNSQYDKYHQAIDQDSMDKYYNNADLLNKSFYVFVGAGTLVWIWDIIYVAVKGSKNRKSGSFGFNYNQDLKTVCFNYSMKF